MKLISIDIGIINLGFICGTLIDKNLIITYCELIDLTELIIECDKKCGLLHENSICDYMMHFFKKYSTKFEECDKIIVERQPLKGITSIQELLLREYRNKCVLISPSTMHKYFDINIYNYERRKKAVEKIATPYLSGFKHFCFQERKHDMADAFCILFYYTRTLIN